MLETSQFTKLSPTKLSRYIVCLYVGVCIRLVGLFGNPGHLSHVLSGSSGCHPLYKITGSDLNGPCMLIIVSDSKLK